MPTTLIDELTDWLRIPSISTGGGDPADLARAADWVCERVEAAGGTAEPDTTHGGNPLAVGELRASAGDAPTVLIYGHYDVQSIGEESDWTTPPFEPDIRDGRIYARGAADDKGNFLPLLHVACALAADDKLPVNVRVLVEGEEEAGSEAVAKWIAADERGADCAVVFDSGMADERTPAVTVGLRGVAMADIRVRTAERDLHSGIYGGSVLNALHVLNGMLATVVPGPDGRPREELRAGVEAPTDAELESWQRLTPGDQVIAEVGGRPVAPNAGRDYYLHNGADTSVDVNEVHGGEPRTVVPATAGATISVRLAPRQDPAAISEAVESLMRAALPDGAEATFEWALAEPALSDADSQPIKLAAEALGRACGVPAALVRVGGSIPAVAELMNHGIPTVVSGFSLPDDAFHAPNESYSLRSLELGERSAHELYAAFASLR
ncbi:MAG TPA: M20/M25/M40 family metallo-hydrolase [Thermoleophilaceae bacterium]|jgi:acetylornithine deacetylase/succinyl-diaminopimelate desuccinylase-like protein